MLISFTELKGSSIPRRRIIFAILLAGAFVRAFHSSARQLLNTYRFSDYKSWQREAMLYLSKHFSKGDIVYGYRNDLPNNLNHKEAYDLHFGVIYGNDVRMILQNFTSYFDNLSNDFSKIEGNNRLWYIYKPYNGIKIGNIEHRPRWYYHGVDAAGKMSDRISMIGKLSALILEQVLHPMSNYVCLTFHTNILREFS